jgi:short-subunit dehydrogenase
MVDWLRAVFAGRPGWMNALLVFCAYMTFVYVPWDFFVKPVAGDEEVWLGILFTGVAAKLTEPLHWAIYAAGTYGFLRMRPWMWPWAAVYAGSVAFGMLVWPLLYLDGFGALLFAVVAFVPFAWLTRALWRAEPLFSASRPSLRERYGEWALITGASAGIGAEFARALAQQGVSCVMAARRTDRLEQLAAELRNAWGVETRVVECDLRAPEAAEALADAVADLEVGVLVNNAGFGAAGLFESQDTATLRDMVQLHCTTPVVLTHRLLAPMRSRGRGAVVFTGSIAGRQPIPLHATYAASKGFELLLGEGLFVELRDAGIDVLVVEPGVTDTEFQSLAGERSLGGEPPARVVLTALDALGRQPSVMVGWLDWLRAGLAARVVPRALASFLARDVFARRLP